MNITPCIKYDAREKLDRKLERMFLYRMTLDDLVSSFQKNNYLEVTLDQIKRNAVFDTSDVSHLHKAVLKSLQH